MDSLDTSVLEQTLRDARRRRDARLARSVTEVLTSAVLEPSELGGDADEPSPLPEKEIE